MVKPEQSQLSDTGINLDFFLKEDERILKKNGEYEGKYDWDECFTILLDDR